MDFEYVPEVVPLLGCMQRKAAGLRLMTLSPCPDALVLAGGRKRGQVLLERGLGWVWPAGAPPASTPRLLLLHPLSGRQLQAKKRKW